MALKDEAFFKHILRLMVLDKMQFTPALEAALKLYGHELSKDYQPNEVRRYIGSGRMKNYYEYLSRELNK